MGLKRLVFMGTPQFAVPSLQALIDSPWDVAAVFCQPDRPKGRSRKPQACPVKTTAQASGIPVFQPNRIRAKSWRQQLENLEPDLIVVAAFGQILSQRILDIPPLGCINVHASLLPRWRGASPIHAAIAAGDSQTGVGIMKMTRGLDEGPVYASEAIAIDEAIGRLALESQLAELGASLLVRTIPKLSGLEPQPQDEKHATYAPIIQKAMGYGDLEHQSAKSLSLLVRAFEDWPNIVFSFRGQPVKVLQAMPVPNPEPLRPGQVHTPDKRTLILGCAGGTALALERLQPAGKKAMTADAFINGYRPQPAERFNTIETGQAPQPFPG